MIFITFLLSSLGLGWSQVTPVCQAALTQLVTDVASQNMTAIQKDVMPYISLTGKSVGAYGDYDACQRNHQYSILKIKPVNLPTVISQGICITNQCTLSELNQNVALLKYLIITYNLQQYIPFDITTTDLWLTDPTDVYPMVGFGTYLTIIILVILVTLSLIIPFVKLKKRLYDEPQKKQELVRQQAEAISQNQINNSVDPNPSTVEESYKVDLAFYKHFSLYHNAKDLFKLTTPDPNLAIFNGFRAISFGMVVMGHTFLCMLLGDISSAPIVFPKPFTMLMFDSFFAVDAFFWIGGFFLAFVMAEEKKISIVRKQGLLSIPLAIMHRLLRLWPCYLMLILLQTNIVSYLGDGPKWEGFIAFAGNCSSKWWQNMLFITIYNEDNTCIAWAWYLDNDVQLFIVGVIIMYIYAVANKLIAKILILCGLIATQVYGAVYTFQHELRIPFFSQFNPDQTFFRGYYVKPWTRAPPYFLGLLVGILYREFKTFLNKRNQGQNLAEAPPLLFKLKMAASKNPTNYYIFIANMYGIGGVLILWLSFGWRKAQTDGPDFWPLWLQESYWAFSRTLYVIGMTLVSLPNFIGCNDWFNTTVMNNGLFKFLTKLSFTGYLVHFTILILLLSQFYEEQRLTVFDGIYLWFGTFLITLIVASAMTLLVEMPFANLENALLKKKPTPQTKKLVQVDID